MIVWTRDPSVLCHSWAHAVAAARAGAFRGSYVIATFVPGVGWSVAIGSPDSRGYADEVEITELVEDRYVKICAFSKPYGADNPTNGGPNRAA